MALQAKLDALVDLAVEGNKEAFVRAFVPLDLTDEELTNYLSDLHDETQWRNLVAEIAACAAGTTVQQITGDQVTTATFFFPHPILTQCDREVRSEHRRRMLWRIT